MLGKTILMRDKELASWWSNIANDDRFERVCALVRAELFETNLTPETLKGANTVLATLANITDNEDKGSKFPSPGLIHQMPEKPKSP